MRTWLTRFLLALQQLIPPPAGGRHALCLDNGARLVLVIQRPEGRHRRFPVVDSTCADPEACAAATAADLLPQLQGGR